MTAASGVARSMCAVLALALPRIGPAQEPAPREGDARRDSDARDLIDDLLDRHHGPLRGKLDQVLLELREAPGEEPARALLALPDRLRVDAPDAAVEVLVDHAGWRCAGREPAERLSGESLEALQKLRHQLRAIVLAPLYEAGKVERRGGGVVSLILPSGEIWRLQLDEAELELQELAGPGGAVRFEEFRDTGVAVLPSVVLLPGERRLHVTFRTNLSVVRDELFADPSLPLAERPASERPTGQRALPNPDELPGEATLRDVGRRMFLVFEDPGDWPGRVALLRSSGERLYRLGQRPDGLPSYRESGEQAQLLIPFRPDEARGSRPFVRGPDDVVLHVPEHRAVVLAPPPGPWHDVLERGRAAIRARLDELDLESDGPMLAIPFVQADAVPDAGELRRLRVRLEQRVR